MAKLEAPTQQNGDEAREESPARVIVNADAISFGITASSLPYRADRSVGPGGRSEPELRSPILVGVVDMAPSETSKSCRATSRDT